METIRVEIDANGGLSYDVKGVRGKSCKELTKAIDALGSVTESKTTAEFCALPQAQGVQNKLGR